MAAPVHTTATAFKQSVGKYLDTVRTSRVFIRRQGRPAAVLLSIEDYEKLDAAAGNVLGLLGERYDSLVAEMQDDTWKQGMKTAFEATPEELGEAYRRGRRRGAH